jgi:hypothetical protein
VEALKMKAGIVSVVLIIAILLSTCCLAAQKEVDVNINMAIRVDNSSRFITMYYPGDSFPPSQTFGDICTSSQSQNISLIFKYPYDFECNMSSIQDDFSSNITFLINLTGQTNQLISDRLSACDEIRQKNMEMSVQLLDYSNKSEQANRAIQLSSQLDSCQNAANTCQTDKNNFADNLKTAQGQQIWIFLFGAAVGAGLLYILKVKKDLPRTPVEDQFNLRG